MIKNIKNKFLKKRNNVLVIIPARGGSKRLIDKNILKIKDIPMVARCALGVKKSKYVDNVYVSSESKKIIQICKNFKINTIKRPNYLSKDKIEKQEVIVHAVKVLKKKLKPQIVVSLQANSPEFDYRDLDKALQFFVKHKVSEIMSVDSDKIQNGCFRIMRTDYVFQKTLSTRIGFFKTNYIDVHTLKEFKKITKIIENQEY